MKNWGVRKTQNGNTKASNKAQDEDEIRNHGTDKSTQISQKETYRINKFSSVWVIGIWNDFVVYEVPRWYDD